MIAPARCAPWQGFDENLEALRGAFDAKDYERAVVADAVLQFVLDSGRPVTPAEARQFLKGHEFAELFSPEAIAVAAIAGIARSTCGLTLKGGVVTVDPESVEIAVGAAEARLAAFRAMDNVRAHPEKDPPRAVGDIVARVKELVGDCCDTERFPGMKGAARAVSPDVRACELAIVERVLGRSPQLEAFLASLVAGDGVPLATVAKSVAKLSDARLPKEPEKLLADAIEFSSVELKGGRVRVEQAFASVIASTRTLLASLRKHLPKPIAAPRAKRVTVPATKEVKVAVVLAAAAPEPVDAPEPESAREEEVVAEAVPAPAPVVAAPVNGHAVVKTPVKKPFVLPDPNRDKRSASIPDVPDKPGRERTIVITTDGRQRSDFDPVKDNPKMYQMLVTHFMDNESMDVKQAEAAAEARMRASIVTTGARSSPAAPATPDPRHEWPLMPSPPMVAPTVWNSGDVAVHESEMPVIVKNAANIFEAVKNAKGNELPDFLPNKGNGFRPTRAVPGSDEKLGVLAGRAELGNPLWHPKDRVDFSNVKLGELSAAARAELAEKEAEIEKRERMDATDAAKKQAKLNGESDESKSKKRGRKPGRAVKHLANEAVVF